MQEVTGYLGYDVRIAPNADDGLALAGRVRPGLILLSLKMPGSNGARVCERVRAELPVDTPVLLLSDRPPSSDLQDEAGMGAQYFAQKPFLANDLAADLYHLCHANFRLPQSGQELLRVTRILPEPPVREPEAPQPQPEPEPEPAAAGQAKENGNGNGNGNGKPHEPVQAVETEPAPEPQPQPEEPKGRRHMKRFAERESSPDRDLEDLIAELNAVRQTTIANAYRIKAIVTVLEEAGLLERGAVDRAMHQLMREPRNGS